jgi:hypothetical protein
MDTTTATTGTAKRGDKLTAAAKAVRVELKATFPGTTFRVRTSRYSMGCSIRVAWDFGPTTRAVEALIGKYQDGDFDGMTDSYSYRQRGPEQVGGAKYVFAERRFGDDGLFEKVCRDIAQACGVAFEGLWTRPWANCRENVSDLAHRALSKADLRDGYHGVRFADGELVATAAPAAEAA